MSTPEEQPQKRDPKSWLFLAAALLPFIVATLYMTYKPAPKRIPRTHGGSANAAPDKADAGQIQRQDVGARSDAGQ